MTILCLLLVIYAVAALVVVLLYMVAWYDYVNFRCKPDEGVWRDNIRYGRILAAVFAESVAMFVHFVTRPLRFVFDRHRPGSGPEKGPPILFVHGWGSASHAFVFISRFLKQRGFKKTYFMTYRPVMTDAAKLSQKLADRIDEVLTAAGSDRLVLVAHSMGAVLARYAIKNLDMEDKVSHVITLGGAHMGSRVAAFMPIGRNTLQLLYQSDFLKDLASAGLTPGKAGYVSIYSAFDEYIIPQDSADLGPGAVNHRLDWHGHARLLYSPRISRLIAEVLETGGPA